MGIEFNLFGGRERNQPPNNLYFKWFDMVSISIIHVFHLLFINFRVIFNLYFMASYPNWFFRGGYMVEVPPEC
jgi:hypothetical protein